MMGVGLGMRSAILVSIAPALVLFTQAAVITQWDFNSAEFDFMPGTGTFEAAVGDGSASAMGARDSFGSVASGATSDLNEGDNTQVRLAGFPTQGTLNKTAGLEFFASTAGYENIRLSWDHYNSGSASRYWRIQYTLDGIEWQDHEVFINQEASKWLLDRSVSLAGVEGAKDNPNFGIRLLAEFEETALGFGAAEYRPVNVEAAYSPNGTFWVDMVRVHGDALDLSNAQPAISEIPPQFIRQDSASPPIPFTISDPETLAQDLEINAISSDPTLVNTFVFSGSGEERTLVVTPEPGAVGTAQVTVRVADEGGKFGESSFHLIVVPSNTPPAISSISDQETTRGAPTGPIAFSVSDPEQFAEQLGVTAHASNVELIASMELFGSGEDRTLVITPAPGAIGLAGITLTVNDGTLETSTDFFVHVLPPHFFARWDFNSNPPDGDAGTGTFEPAFATGSITLIGSVAPSFGSVAGGSSDPVASDNSMLRLGGWPVQGTENKTSGIELRVSTEGRKNIAFVWDHYNSNTASRYWRIQYSTNGFEFIDYHAFTNTVPAVWHNHQVSDLANLPGVANNPNFALRLVSEFESTAMGMGNDQYDAVNGDSNYGISGTLWVDRLGIAGDPLDEITPVNLLVSRSGDQLEISWPASGEFYQLESTDSLAWPLWLPVLEAPSISNGHYFIYLPTDQGTQFFRLVQ